MNTELDDDIFDEIYWEIDYEDYNEGEIEECETELGEDTERWGNDGDFAKK